MNQSFVAGLSELSPFLSFCYLNTSLDKEALLSVVSSLRTSNPRLQMIYSGSGTKQSFQRTASVVRAIKFESNIVLENTLKKIPNFTVINNPDKIRAFTSIALGKGEELMQLEAHLKESKKKYGKENLLMVYTDSKKLKELVISSSQEQGLPVAGRKDWSKERDASFGNQGKDYPLLIIPTLGFTENGSDQFECGNQLILTIPRSVDHLLTSLQWSYLTDHTLITSHKDYYGQRQKLLQRFIDPVGLLKLLRLIKKYIGKPGLFKLNITETLSWLGVLERSSLTWVIEELVRLGTLDYIGVISTLIHVEVVSQNTAKSQNQFLKELTSRSLFVCGKYKVNPLTFMSLDPMLIEKLKAEPIVMLAREDFNQIANCIQKFNNELHAAKQQGLVNFEVKDQILLTELSGQLSEIDIQRLINRCWLQEKTSLNNVQFFYKA